MKSPAPRKLHIPGKLTIPEPPPPAPPEPPPACVAPRRRFVLRFLLITGLLVLLGNFIYYTRLVLAHAEPDINLFTLTTHIILGVSQLAMLEATAFVFLLVPAHSARSSLLQLIGLVLPLLVAIAACALSGAETHLGWGYGAFICLLSLGGVLYFHLPGFLLHFVLVLIGKYRKLA